MILASILISKDDRAEIPPLIAENIASFRAAHPELEHRLFGNEAIRALLADDFGAEVLRAYDTLRPFAYKADLARLCILHRFGGVYADLACYFFSRWPPIDAPALDPPRLSVFRDFLTASPWDTTQSIIAAPAQHKALAKGIELICAHVAQRYYGVSPLCPTGPTCFGKAIALTCEPEDLLVGQSTIIMEPIAPNLLPHRPHGFVLGAKLIAAKRKRHPSLAELGLTTGNSYVGLWHAKSVYAAGDDRPHGPPAATQAA